MFSGRVLADVKHVRRIQQRPRRAVACSIYTTAVLL